MGHFNPKNFVADFGNTRKKRDIAFRNEGGGCGGGQRPFGSFPKIHPFFVNLGVSKKLP